MLRGQEGRDLAGGKRVDQDLGARFGAHRRDRCDVPDGRPVGRIQRGMVRLDERKQLRFPLPRRGFSEQVEGPVALAGDEAAGREQDPIAVRGPHRTAVAARIEGEPHRGVALQIVDPDVLGVPDGGDHPRPVA